MPDDSFLVSQGRAALVSASTLLVREAEGGPSGGAREKAGGGDESGSVTVDSVRFTLLVEGKYREEKAGGGELVVDEACGAARSV